MLKKQTQRKLAVYLSAMIFLNGMLFYRSLHGIAIGLSDFTIFYTAAEILHDGEGHHLYDPSVQERFQSATVPGAVSERLGAVLPYNHPAFEAYLFLPLAFLSYRTAYLIWFAINLGILAVIIGMLRKHLLFVGQLPLYLWIAACLAFTPIAVALMQGQDSILLLFCYCMAFIALLRSSELLAGIWVASGLFKFQLSFPFMVPFLLTKRWRIFAGFCLAGIFLLLITLKVVGWEGLTTYPAYVWDLDRHPKFHWLVSAAGMPNARGLISALVPQTRPGISVSLLLIASLMLLSALSFGMHGMFNTAQRRIELPFAANLIASLLLSYHAWLHDVSILFLAFILILENAASDRLFLPSRARTISLACILLLWSPLYLILSHFQALEFLAAVLLVLLGTTLIENHHANSLNPNSLVTDSNARALAGDSNE